MTLRSSYILCAMAHATVFLPSPGAPCNKQQSVVHVGVVTAMIEVQLMLTVCCQLLDPAQLLAQLISGAVNDDNTALGVQSSPCPQLWHSPHQVHGDQGRFAVAAVVAVAC